MPLFPLQAVFCKSGGDGCNLTLPPTPSPRPSGERAGARGFELVRFLRFYGEGFNNRPPHPAPLLLLGRRGRNTAVVSSCARQVRLAEPSANQRSRRRTSSLISWSSPMSPVSHQVTHSRLWLAGCILTLSLVGKSGPVAPGDWKVARTRGQECPRHVAQAFPPSRRAKAPLRRDGGQPAGSGDFPVPS
jgi:hypothetical protein